MRLLKTTPWRRTLAAFAACSFLATGTQGQTSGPFGRLHTVGTFPGKRAFRAGDLNGDGIADVLVQDQLLIPQNAGTGGGLNNAPVFLVRSGFDGAVLWNLSPSDTQNMTAAFQPVVAVDANGNGL